MYNGILYGDKIWGGVRKFCRVSSVTSREEFKFQQGKTNNYQSINGKNLCTISVDDRFYRKEDLNACLQRKKALRECQW